MSNRVSIVSRLTFDKQISTAYKQGVLGLEISRTLEGVWDSHEEALSFARDWFKSYLPNKSIEIKEIYGASGKRMLTTVLCETLNNYDHMFVLNEVELNKPVHWQGKTDIPVTNDSGQV